MIKIAASINKKEVTVKKNNDLKITVKCTTHLEASTLKALLNEFIRNEGANEGTWNDLVSAIATMSNVEMIEQLQENRR